MGKEKVQNAQRTMGKKKVPNAQRTMGKKEAPNAQWGKRKRQTHNGEKESAKRTMKNKSYKLCIPNCNASKSSIQAPTREPLPHTLFCAI